MWAIATVCIFIAFGFVDVAAGAVWKGPNDLWSHVGILVSGDYICSANEILCAVLFQAASLIVPAVIAGWLAQAFIVVARTSLCVASPSKGAHAVDVRLPIPSTTIYQAPGHAGSFPRGAADEATQRTDWN
jgi:hypothetical protein